MLTILRKLRKPIDVCNSCELSQLRRNLCIEADHLIDASIGFSNYCEAAADDVPDLLDQLAAEGTVPQAYLRLLDRILTSQPSGPMGHPGARAAGPSAPPALQPLLGNAELAALNSLLCLSKGYLHLILRNHRHLSPGSPMLLALAAAQPCRLLSSTLIQVNNLEQANAPLPPPPEHRVMCPVIREAVVDSSCGLLMLAAVWEPAMAALGLQLAAPGLWGPVCGSAAAVRLPQMVSCANRVATYFAEYHKASTGAESMLPGCRHPLAPAVHAALAAEATSWALLLRAAAVRDPCLAPAVMENLWVGLQELAGVDRPTAPLVLLLSPQHVIDIAAAVPGDGAPLTHELYVMLRLYECLDGHADRQRAFLATAACAERTLALALSCGEALSAVSGAPASRHSLAAFCRVATSLPAVLVGAAATTELDPGVNPRAAAEWKGLGTRARWMAQRGMVANCEALLRANTWRTEAATAGPTSLETRCALSVAVLLLDDNLLGPAAVEACVSMFASQRKALLCWVATLAGGTSSAGGSLHFASGVPTTQAAFTADITTDTAAVASPAAAPAAHPTTCAAILAAQLAAQRGTHAPGLLTACNSIGKASASVSSAAPPHSSATAATSDSRGGGGISHATPAAAATGANHPAASSSEAVELPRQHTMALRAAADSRLQALADGHATAWGAGTPGLSSSASNSITSGRSSLLALAVCLQRCEVLCSLPCLLARRSAGCPAAGRLLVACAHQLLPVVVQLAMRRAQVQPPCREDSGTWLRLLIFLEDLNKWGMLDLTAAAGAPALLRWLLRNLPLNLTDTAFILGSAADIVRLGAGSAAWLRETARLSLLAELAARVAELQGHVALVALSAHDGDPAGTGMAGAGIELWSYRPGQPPILAAERPQRDMAGVVLDTARAVDEGMKQHAGLSEPVLLAGQSGSALWDRHMLRTRHEEGPAAAAPGRPAWVGCCHRGCTNVSGSSSEATLRLKACKRCALARYCSVACQRKAWRSGHRAACLDWQAQQAQIHDQST